MPSGTDLLAAPDGRRAHACPATITFKEQQKNAVELRGLEPRTPCLQSRCSSQLSYSPDVGLAGVEPATSRLSGVRSNQPELQAHGMVSRRPPHLRKSHREALLRPEHTDDHTASRQGQGSP